MMRVLGEQEVESRRRKPRRRSQPRRARSAPGVVARLRTILLSVLTLALGVALVFLVPELEAEIAAAGANGSDVMLEAEAPTLPALKAGLVEFERTDDIEYIVADGETLSEIARRFEIDYETLAGFNELADPDTIAAGQVIVVPGTIRRLLGAEEK